MGFSLSSWLQIRRLYFPNLATMVKSVQRGKQGGQKSLIHSAGVTDPFSCDTALHMKGCEVSIGLGQFHFLWAFRTTSEWIQPSRCAGLSKANETAPLKTSFPGKCCCSLARAFCRFALVSLWFQGFREIALNKPKLWKFKCYIFLLWIRQHIWNGFPILIFYI